MKKLILILSIIGLAIISCEDQHEYCWECTTETVIEHYRRNPCSITVYPVCGMTYDDREEFEIANTYVDGYKRVTTNCKLDN